MRKIILVFNLVLLGVGIGFAQPKESMYGDAAKVDVKMKYVYSFEEALRKAKEEHKLIFFNCFADWAVPCHGMNQAVFSNQEFADWMDQHFVNFFMDVTTYEGRPLAEKYNIRFQAHYLILDSEGNIVHRIVGGSKLPEFKEQVARALNPKTSLVGLNKRYEAGERSAKFLKLYASVLRYADENGMYDSITTQYFAKIKKKDWPKQENYVFFRSKVREPKGEMFEYLMSHKADFVKENDEKTINTFISSLYFMPVYLMATGEKEYEGKKLLDIYMTLKKVEIPEDYTIFTVYEIAKYRGERNFDRMMEVFEKKVAGVDERTASGLNMSLKDLKEPTQQEVARVVAYLTKCAEQTTGKLQNEYKSMVKDMVDPEGIQFLNLSFKEALDKAKAERKLLFIDCYTAWCGPCKMMSKQVFTQKAIGDFFNENFVNLKIDMEKGEGPELQKKYGVSAYPTMMLLDGEGNIIYKILGGSDGRAFMEKVKRGVQPEFCYHVLKEKYEAGDRSVDVVPAYFITMQDAGELKDGNKVIQNYLSLLKDQEKFSKPVWKIYDFMINDYKMPEFQFVCENRKRFAEANGEEVVNHKIEEMIFPVVIGYFRGENNQEAMNDVKMLMTKAELPADFSLSYLQQILGLHESKSVDKLLDFYEAKVAEIQDAHTKLNLDVLLNTLMAQATETQKERAIAYVKKCEKAADPRALRGYQNLLQALTKKN